MASSTDPGRVQSGPVAERRAWLPRVLFESLLIVLSVLLALALDEWREQRERADRAAAAVASIAAELRVNRRSVARAHENHLAKRDSVRLYLERGQPPPPHVYLDKLFNPGLVQSTAWESARETGVSSYMPWELLLNLSLAYERQSRYRSLGDAMVQDVMGQIRRVGMEAVLRDQAASFIALQEDFAGRETVLLEVYDSTLARLSRRER